MRFATCCLLLFCVLSLFFSTALCDIYLHNPKGSNNRLNEATAQRTNGNRLMDTQNNNRGGYNVGEKTTAAGVMSTPGLIYNLVNFATAIQYPMLYFEESILTLEWTVQHGCGGNEANDPHQQNCEMILQYMCETNIPSGSYFNSQNTRYVHIDRIQDGVTVTNNDQGEPENFRTTFTLPSINNGNPTPIPQQNGQNGRHESELYFFYCTQRSRNYGLFTADQQINGGNAQFTRQNNNGGRSGLECSEERDYYPYWAPSPWKDIAILTDHPDKCPYYLANSQNVATVYQCEYGPGVTSITNVNAQNQGNNNPPLYPITKDACAQTKPPGVWQAYSNSVVKNGAPAYPDCIQSEWTRTNHHGNGRHGVAQRYVWTLPSIADLKASNVATDTSATNPQVSGQTVEMAACVFRIRYNISTDDYDPWNIDATSNNNPNANILSPVTNNPTVDVGGGNVVGLQLAVNTAQYGRTFQDRSHKFYIAARPAQFQGKKIYNLNIRGKRGDITQVFPAVEYDFIPNDLTLNGTDIVHIQWTGSNTHNNGGDGGDGQAGDAGQGNEGTDRNNMVLSLSPQDNYPFPLDKFPINLWSLSTCYDMYGNTISSPSNGNSWVDCGMIMATSGYFRSAAAVNNSFDPLLNIAPPSLVGGVLLQIQPNAMFSSTPTPFYYFCSRNNAFTNRSQKGVLYYVSQ